MFNVQLVFHNFVELPTTENYDYDISFILKLSETKFTYTNKKLIETKLSIKFRVIRRIIKLDDILS